MRREAAIVHKAADLGRRDRETVLCNHLIRSGEHREERLPKLFRGRLCLPG
jgi:hypothetical protein